MVSCRHGSSCVCLGLVCVPIAMLIRSVSFRRYHDENTKLEDLTHPEDIEHFKKHEMMDEEQERIEEMEKKSIVLENVPEKFMKPT